MSVMAWLDRYKWLFGGLVLLGISWGTLQASISDKASKDDVTTMRIELQEIRLTLKLMMEKQDDMDARQRAWFCLNQPSWCR